MADLEMRAARSDGVALGNEMVDLVLAPRPMLRVVGGAPGSPSDLGHAVSDEVEAQIVRRRIERQEDPDVIAAFRAGLIETVVERMRAAVAGMRTAHQDGGGGPWPQVLTIRAAQPERAQGVAGIASVTVSGSCQSRSTSTPPLPPCSIVD